MELNGLMSAWNEYDAVVCMREFSCEKIEKAHTNVWFVLTLRIFMKI